MADLENESGLTGENEAIDVDMGGDEVIDVDNRAEAVNNNGDGENGLPFQDEEEEEVPARITYIDHLKSPVVELVVGQGEDATHLTTHQALLIQSPFFADAYAQFGANTAVYGDSVAKLLAAADTDDRSVPSSSLTKILMPWAAFSNISTPVNTSLRR
jgi:hypothetical protein